MSHLDSKITKLRNELDRYHYRLKCLSNMLETKNRDPFEIVYEFQTLMDGLIPIKGKADQLTRALDHG